jgi:acyl-CoA reductase-like NAD-dependent aldehyde dehydrogenase
MASEDEETTVAAVPHIVKDLQRTVRSGITRTAEWRMQQLRAILKLVQETEERIIQVIAQDIGKPSHEAFLTEVCSLALSLSLSLSLSLQLHSNPQQFGSEKTRKKFMIQERPLSKINCMKNPKDQLQLQIQDQQ